MHPFTGESTDDNSSESHPSYCLFHIGRSCLAFVATVFPLSRFCHSSLFVGPSFLLERLHLFFSAAPSSLFSILFAISFILFPLFSRFLFTFSSFSTIRYPISSSSYHPHLHFFLFPLSLTLLLPFFYRVFFSPSHLHLIHSYCHPYLLLLSF